MIFKKKITSKPAAKSVTKTKEKIVAPSNKTEKTEKKCRDFTINPHQRLLTAEGWKRRVMKKKLARLSKGMKTAKSTK